MTRGFRDEDSERLPPAPPVTYRDVHCARATPKALHCTFTVTRRSGESAQVTAWVPQSQVHEDSEVYDAGHTGKLVVTGWFADKLADEGIPHP